MIGEAFEFKGDGAEGLGARGYGATGEGFDGLTIGGGVADGGVAGKRFHVMDGARMGAAGKRAFDAAMLIAEGDFQVQNFFAVALEAEMAGLDDAGMDGADGDFVGLPAGNAEEIADGGRDGRGWVALPGELSDLVSGAIEKVIGIRPDLSTTGGTSDARFLSQICPVVEFGLCNATMHKLDEAAALDDIRELTKIYAEIIARASE